MEWRGLAPITVLDREQAPANGAAWWRKPGLWTSFLLHAAIIVLLLSHFPNRDLFRRTVIFPVEIVAVEPQTAPTPPTAAAPPRQQSASVRPQVKRSPPQSAPLLLQEQPSAPPKGEEPVPEPPKDALQSRLEAFARLSLPGNGAITAGGNGSARGPSAYDVRDFVRAQVERRWSVDLDAFAARDMTVAIHVILAPDGAVRKAEIVNDRRSDPDYHSLALSARNAAILSSPIALPAGTPVSALDMILTLTPKDVVR